MGEKEVASMVAREEKRKSMCDRDSALATLEDFRAGKIDESEWVGMIHRFGRAYLIEARVDIERFLTSEKPVLRYTALHVLTLYFKLQEHWMTAIDFLLYDPDISCRSEGAAALGWLKRDTIETRTLNILASVVLNENDEVEVRESAYISMRAIFRYDNEEQLYMVSLDFELEHDADWEFVRGCLDPRLKDEWRVEAQRVLERYLAGKVAESEYYAMLLKFGQGRLQEARKIIESFLRSSDSLLRQAALRVLVLDLQVPNNRRLVIDAFLHDSDLSYRQTALETLGQLMRNTRDKTVLRLLDQCSGQSMDVYSVMEMIYGGPYEEVEKFLAVPDEVA